MFGYAMMVVEGGLCSPANIECGDDVARSPVHDVAELWPIAHLLKGKMLQRSACNDESVPVLLLDLLKIGIIGLHVLLRGSLISLPTDFERHKHDVYACSAQHAHDVALGDLLLGHEVEQKDFQT